MDYKKDFFIYNYLYNKLSDGVGAVFEFYWLVDFFNKILNKEIIISQRYIQPHIIKYLKFKTLIYYINKILQEHPELAKDKLTIEHFKSLETQGPFVRNNGLLKSYIIYTPTYSTKWVPFTKNQCPGYVFSQIEIEEAEKAYIKTPGGCSLTPRGSL